jgi:heptosyltransferase-2
MIKKVVVRAPNWMGDAVMAEPALRELRRIFSHANVTIAAHGRVAGIFDGEDLADEIIEFDGGRELVRALRRRSFDLAVLLTNSFGSALAARAAGAAKIAGYPTDMRRPLLDIAIPLDSNNQHQVFYYLRIASELERSLFGQSRVDLNSARPRLRARTPLRQRAERILDEVGIRLDRPIVAISPGATNSRAKQWPPERFAQVADMLSSDLGSQTIIIGSASDVDLAIEVSSRMRSPASALAGKTTSSELKGVLSLASLTISNDAGAAHLSAALGVPTAIIFGPTEHLATRPLSDRAELIRRDVACSPCMLRRCPIDHRCMRLVQAAEVRAAALRLLARKPH